MRNVRTFDWGYVANDNLSEGELRLLAKFQFDQAAQRRQRADRLPYDQRRSRRPPRVLRVPAPKPGTIAAVIYEIEQCGAQTSEDRAILWAREFFEPNQVRAWLEAGLRTADLGLIIDFRTLGVPPEAMSWAIRGESVLDRIRIRQYSAHDVTRTLQNAGLLTRKSA